MIRVLLTAMVALFISSCAWFTSAPPPEKEAQTPETEIRPNVRATAENFVTQGVSYYQGKEYEQAVSVWQKALELIPGDAEVHNFIGISYHELKRMDEAITHFRIAADLDSNYYEAYNNLGYELFLKKKYGDAHNAFQTALKINPNYEAAKLNIEKTKAIMSGELSREVFELAEQAAKLEDVDQQVDFYEKILMIDSSNAEIHNNLGVAYYYADSLDGAYDHLNKALRLNSNYPEAINNMGYIFKVAGRYQEAVQLFLKAISLKQKYVISLNNLGEAYMLMQENENAHRVFQTVLEIDPANTYAKDSLTKILSMSGN